MIFSELYSAYYNTVAKILEKIIEGEKEELKLQEIVSENAFGESVLTIIPALKSGKWQLVHKNFSTPIKNKPTMPLTILQKRWLKAISLDPRIKLFNVDFSWLDGIEPLFTPNDYYIFDKYADGDDFTNESYVKHFQTVLLAIKKEQAIKLTFLNKANVHVTLNCTPEKLEYSEKDDKFRILIKRNGNITTVNMAKVTSCSFYYGEIVRTRMARPVQMEELLLKIKDERNVMERCMLHFAHFEKRAEKVGDKDYLLYIKYDKQDRSELVVRTLSFGPFVEVLSPKEFREEIIAKLKNQIKFI